MPVGPSGQICDSMQALRRSPLDSFEVIDEADAPEWPDLRFQASPRTQSVGGDDCQTRWAARCTLDPSLKTPTNGFLSMLRLDS
ncbi:hypothetical protein LTR95_010597 [Oleoguttula sp. CCFEE 5521]